MSTQPLNDEVEVTNEMTTEIADETQKCNKLTHEIIIEFEQSGYLALGLSLEFNPQPAVRIYFAYFKIRSYSNLSSFFF